MSKKEYTSLPDHYPVCMHSDCPMAKTCLHQLAYATILENDEYLHLINPNRCNKDETCVYYRNNKPVAYARGFTNFQKCMFPNQYKLFMGILISKFGRNPYFERRRGDIALSPDEQKVILEAIKRVGITEKMEFDKYEEKTNWYD